MRRVLVVDDEENIRLVLRTLLKKHGFEVEVADGGEAALAMLDSFDPDVILTDVRMPRMGGMDLLATLRAKQHPATVIVMSAYGNVDLALEAMKAGAYDYVSKPFKPDEVVLALRKAEERETLRRENRALREQIQKENQFESILAKSKEMQEIFRTITKIADFKTTVLITGESGTGKELVARAIHSRSGRKDKPFTAINCGAIPENLLESELFGHKKGAFTDASADRRGLFEEASGGTLFLDEIGELPLNLQVKLLRVVQEESIRRLGDVKDVKVDVRIITATHRDLAADVKSGRFREDLFYRINVVRIHVPPLRERGDDVHLLARTFIDRHGAAGHRPVLGLTPGASARLARYPWPGNVRELQNCIESAVTMAQLDCIDVHDLPEKIRDYQAPGPTPDGNDPNVLLPMEEVERRHILRVLDAAGGNKTLAAQILGFDRRTLYRKLERTKE